MKKFLDCVPVLSLFLFLLLCAFNPDSIGSAVGLVASSLLFAYQQWLFKQESPDYSTIISQLESKVNQVESDHKKDFGNLSLEVNKEITQLRDSLSGVNLSSTKVTTIGTKEKSRITF